MKTAAYPGNRYYELLIYLLIKFGTTYFPLTEPQKKSLTSEALQEIDLVLKANTVLSEKFDALKLHRLEQILGYGETVPSLFDLTTSVVLEKNIAIKNFAELQGKVNELNKSRRKLLFNETIIKLSKDNLFGKESKKTGLSHVISSLVSCISTNEIRFNVIELAIRFGNKNLIVSFIENHPDNIQIAGIQRSFLREVFKAACYFNNSNAIEYLLFYPNSKEKLATLNKEALQKIKNRAENETFLHIACEQGNKYAMALLLQIGVDPNPVDSYGNSPLYIIYFANGVTHEKRFERFKMLLEAGINFHIFKNGELFLHYLVQQQDKDNETIKILIEYYQKNGELEKALETQGSFGATFLHYAAKSNLDIEIIENIFTSYENMVSLISALYEDKTEIEKALEKNENREEVFFDYANKYNMDSKIVITLFDSYVNINKQPRDLQKLINSRNNSGITPIQHATKYGNLDLLKLLTKHSTQVSVVSFGDQTPLSSIPFGFFTEKRGQMEQTLEEANPKSIQHEKSVRRRTKILRVGSVLLFLLALSAAYWAGKASSLEATLVRVAIAVILMTGCCGGISYSSFLSKRGLKEAEQISPEEKADENTPLLSNTYGNTFRPVLGERNTNSSVVIPINNSDDDEQSLEDSRTQPDKPGNKEEILVLSEENDQKTERNNFGSNI